MSHRKLLGLIGSSVLFLGVFCPIISAPIVGSMNYFQDGKGNGAIVLMLAVMSLALTLLGQYKQLWVTALASAAAILHTFINFQLQWGFALLVIGVVILMVCAAKNTNEINEESKSSFLKSLVIIGIVIVIAIGVLKVAGLEENRNVETEKATTNAVEPPPEFQPDWTTIPKDFKGDSIVELTKRLDKSKGEFETTDAFNAKIKAIAESKENFVFIDDVGRISLRSSQIEYDAEKEQFEIKIFYSYTDNTIELKEESWETEPAEAQNAMGAKFQMTTKYITSFNIYWLNPQIERRKNIRKNIIDNSLSYMLYPKRYENKGLASDFFKFFVKIPRDEAAKHKNKMKALYIVKLIENHNNPSIYSSTRKVNNYLQSYFYSGNATIDLPWKRNQWNEYISVSIDEIWLYSSLDGKVFEKKSLRNIDWQKIW